MTPAPIYKQALYSAPVQPVSYAQPVITKSYLPPVAPVSYAAPVVAKSFVPAVNQYAYTAPLSKVATYTPTSNILTVPAIKTVAYPKITPGYLPPAPVYKGL